MSLDSKADCTGADFKIGRNCGGSGHRRSAPSRALPQSSVTAVLVAGAATERGVDPPPWFVRAW